MNKIMHPRQLHPGQLVECVDDRLTDKSADPYIVFSLDGLQRGRIYTVRWAGIYADREAAPEYMVRLEEIHRGQCGVDPTIFDRPYRASRFRPVDEGRLEVFRAMLAPTRETV